MSSWCSRSTRLSRISLSQTLTSMISAPGVGADAYKDLFERQITIVPNAVGIWTLLTKDAPTAADPALMSSQFGLADGYFGPSITRDTETGATTWGGPGPVAGERLQGPGSSIRWPRARPRWSAPISTTASCSPRASPSSRDAAGKDVGLIGVDYNGGVFADLIGQHHPLGTGWVGIINAAGNWVVPPDPALIGQPASDAAAQAAVAGAAAGELSRHRTGRRPAVAR